MYGQSRIKELTILSMSGSPKSQKKCRTDICVKINSPHLTLMLWFKTLLLIRPGVPITHGQSHSPELRLAANYNFPHCPKSTSDNLENK